MDLGRIAVRAFVAFVYLNVVTRFAGKRIVSQATPFDFVVSLILGDMFDDALWAEVSMAKFAVGVGSIIVTDILVKMVAMRVDWFFRLVNGTPSIVMRDGYREDDALRRQQIHQGELEGLLRLEEIDDPRDVHVATLDMGHSLSVIRTHGAEELQRSDRDKVLERMK